MTYSYLFDGGRVVIIGVCRGTKVWGKVFFFSKYVHVQQADLYKNFQFYRSKKMHRMQFSPNSYRQIVNFTKFLKKFTIVANAEI